MSDNKRNIAVDITRGIAIICVVLGHMGIWEVNKIVFTFHLPVFYFITGYFFKQNFEFKPFIIKNLKRLIIPYYFFGILMILAVGVINEIFFPEVPTKAKMLVWVKGLIYGAGDPYSEPFTINYIGPTWFLWATFWGTLFLFFILKIKKPVIRIIAVLLIFFAADWSRLHIFWFPLSIQAGGTALLFMYIGFLAKDLKDVINKVSKESKLLFTAFAFILWYTFMRDFKSFWLVHCDIGYGFIDIVRSLCGAYCIFIIAKYVFMKIPLLNKYLAFMGKNSLLILGFHLIETNAFPYADIYFRLLDRGITMNQIRICVLPFAILYMSLGALLITKIKPIRKLLGMK